MADARLHSPSAARNAGPIAEAWGALLPTRARARVLEVASGTGEHAARLCVAHAGLVWQPSDPDPDKHASIAAWAASVPQGRCAGPLPLDVTAPGWWREAGPADVVFCANMIHIAPPEATEGLLRGAAALLTREEGGEAGRLALYGPFSRRGVMAASNRAFDASLRARDPAWGVRDLDDHVQPAAARFGMALSAVHAMPANNLMVVFEAG